MMTHEQASTVSRPAITEGATYIFYSTAETAVSEQQKLLYLYSGKPVRVYMEGDYDDECEPLWIVQTEDGDCFTAYEGELNGFYFDTGQFFGPEGKWGMA